MLLVGVILPQYMIWLTFHFQTKLTEWWGSITGNNKRNQLARVRRGGPWNMYLELYYNLLDEGKVEGEITDKQFKVHVANVERRSDQVSTCTCNYCTSIRQSLLLIKLVQKLMISMCMIII